MRQFAFILLLLALAPAAWGQQYADPVDGTEGGTSWTGWCGTTTDACGCLADGANGLGDTTGDGTEVNQDGASDTFYCELADLTDPSDTTNTFLRYRVYRSSNKTNSLQIRVCNTTDCTDGNDPIADSGAYEVTDGTVALVTVPTDRGTMNAANINSYTTLYVVMTASATNPTDVFLVDVQLQVPAAGGRSRRMF